MKSELLNPDEYSSQFCTGELIFPNKVRLKCVGIQHTTEYFQNNKNDLERIIATTEFVGVESDESKLDNSIAKDAPGFYDLIFETAWKYKKTVICCDPSAETAIYSFLNFSLGAGSLAVELEIALDLAARFRLKEITRRDFFKFGALGGAAFINLSSSHGDVLRFVTQTCGGSSPRPVATDSLSYTQFRNSAFMLGFGQLAKLGVLNNTKGTQFVGAGHINDYNGYTNNGLVDLNKASKIYKNNVYLYLLRRENRKPSVRVWMPTAKTNDFELKLRLPLEN